MKEDDFKEEEIISFEESEPSGVAAFEITKPITSPPSKVPRTPKKRRPWRAIIIPFVVVICGLGFYLLFSQKASPKETPSLDSIKQEYNRLNLSIDRFSSKTQKLPQDKNSLQRLLEETHDILARLAKVRLQLGSIPSTDSHVEGIWLMNALRSLKKEETRLTSIKKKISRQLTSLSVTPVTSLEKPTPLVKDNQPEDISPKETEAIQDQEWQDLEFKDEELAIDNSKPSEVELPQEDKPKQNTDESETPQEPPPETKETPDEKPEEKVPTQEELLKSANEKIIEARDQLKQINPEIKDPPSGNKERLVELIQKIQQILGLLRHARHIYEQVRNENKTPKYEYLDKNIDRIDKIFRYLILAREKLREILNPGGGCGCCGG
jgi:hypothetical protein